MTKNKKQKKWTKMKSKIDNIVDGLGYPIDKGIKETIVALSVLGFPTSSSCEGHPYNTHGNPYPWLNCDVTMNPSFKKEKGLLERIRKQAKSKANDKYGEKYGNDKYQWPEKIISEWSRYLYRIIKSSQTAGSRKALEKIKKANDVLRKKLQELLEEFYEKNVPGNITYRTRSFDAQHIVLLEPKRVPKFSGKKDTNHFLKETQKEMNKITRFLKGKFLGN